jgi:hypothetical protein
MLLRGVLRGKSISNITNHTGFHRASSFLNVYKGHIHGNSKWSPDDSELVLNFSCLKLQKFKIMRFKKSKKISRRSQCCTLSLCKFITLYFRLNNNKILTKRQNQVSFYSSLLSTDSKVLIYHFCRAQSITYFGLKCCTLMKYSIVYFMVFFRNFLRHLNSKFQRFEIRSPWSSSSKWPFPHIPLFFFSNFVGISTKVIQN